MLEKFRMMFSTVLSFAFLWYFRIVSTQVFDAPGRVFIGQENETTSSLYFSDNQPVATFLVPVYVDVYNGSTGVAAVNVTCGVETFFTGYSRATFLLVEIGIGNPSVGPFFGNVSFSKQLSGRSSIIRCWCVGPSPFTRDATISDAQNFTIFPRGLVNLYSRSYIMGTPIHVKLSQVVLGNDVLVTCRGDSPFQTTNVSFPVGSQISAVPYTPRYNVSFPVNIFCFGQSQNNGYQFLVANSNGQNATITPFVLVVSLQPESSILNQDRMQAVLSINRAPVSDSVVFACTVSTVHNWDAARNITRQVGCTSVPQTTPRPGEISTTQNIFTTADRANSTLLTTSPPTANFSGVWQLKESSFVFTNSNPRSYLFRILELERISEVTEPVEELVVTRCCSAEPLSNNPYLNSAASLVAAVTLTPPLSINWTLATAPVNMTLETPIINPAYKNLAPCPCNLTVGACDINCCCDTECTQADIEVFRCIGGYFGGMEGERSHDFCGPTYYDTPGWFPIMCIHDENSAFLGNFFYPTGLIRNQTAFDVTMSSRFEYSFSQSYTIFPGEPTGSRLGYSKGLALKTGLQIPPATFQIGPNYILTLPQQRIWSSPVQFLVDTDSFLVQNMSQSSSICAQDSPLSALMYAQSPTWGSATGPVVLKEQGQAVVASINVNFLCDDSGERYEASGVTFDDVVLPSEVRFFGLQGNTGEDCRFHEITGAYVCGNYSVGGAPISVSLPPRCYWDDGYTAPPSPVLGDSSSSSCNNSVVRVLYDFTWDGQTVLYLNATIILAPVSFTVESRNVSTMLSQRFTAKFMSAPTNRSSTGNGGMEVLPASGNPGYNLSLPVISGISVLRNGTSEVQYIDTNASSRLSLWSPGFSSLCDGSSRSPIGFGVNSIGQCALRLSVASFESCDLLRKQVLGGQDSIMPSNYISLVGNPSADNLTDWTTIIREDISHVINNTLSNAITTALTGAFTSQTTQGQPTTAPSSSVMPPSSSDYHKEIKGSCDNIPAGIELDVLYTVAGKSNGQPIHRIVGAKIRYILSTWHLNCGGANGAICRTNSTLVQSFIVSSAVNFIKIPPKPEPELSKFQERNYAPAYICRENICWHQIFYPFTKANEGDDQQHTIALGLAFLMVLIYFVFLSFPLPGEFLKLLHH